MIDLESADGISRLYKSIEENRKKLKPFRENRLRAIRDFVGRQYGDDKQNPYVPLNMLEKAYTIFIHQLVSATPQVDIQSRNPELRGMAEDVAEVINHKLKSQQFGDVLEEMVGDALFCLGIVKTGYEMTGEYVESPLTGETFPVGRDYSKLVSIDDWVHDVTAKRLDVREMAYCGHRIRLDLDEARQNPRWDEAIRATLKPLHRQHVNESGDTRTEQLTQGNHDDRDVASSQTEVWELFLPKEQLVVTLPREETFEGKARILAAEEWRGHEDGPFDFLYFTRVPDNSMPLAPVHLWKDMHDIGNNLYRKLSRQAENQKDVLLSTLGREEDTQKVINSADLDAVAVSDPSTFNQVSFNGPNQMNQGFLANHLGIFNNFAGNLDLLGGLAAQTDTVGQDAMLQAGAGTRIESMSLRIQKTTRKILEKRAWYIWNDPLAVMETMREVPDLKVSIPVRITPEQREGNFHHFLFEIRPYSLTDKSPQQRLQEIMAIVQQIMPLFPFLQQQGILFNAQEFLGTIARYGNLPEVERIFQEAGDFQMAEMQQGGGGGEGSHPQQSYSPPVTRRDNVRHQAQGNMDDQYTGMMDMVGQMGGAGGQ